ncbi:hypothetical protein CR513_44734, partial [Mucuna pruriens]
MIPSRFDYIVIAIEESKNLDGMTIEELQSSLEACELWLTTRDGNKQLVQALQDQEFKKGENEFKILIKKCIILIKIMMITQKERHIKEKVDEGSLTREKFNVMCATIMVILQMSADITKAPKMLERKLSLLKNEDNPYEFFLMVTKPTNESNANFWYLDLGCSNHMTRRRDRFTKLDESVKSKVRFANDNFVSPEGVGRILIRQKKYEEQSLKLKQRKLMLFDNTRRSILKVPLSKNRTFKINIQICQYKCLTITINDESWLWHEHLNWRSLQELRRSFNSNVQSKTSNPLELVDLEGTIILSHLWMITTKNDEVLDVFIKFKMMVEKQCRKKIKILKANGSGEYNSTEFQKVCDQWGISHKVTTPYTPLTQWCSRNEE